MKIWIGAGVAVLAIAAGSALLWRDAPEDSDPLTGFNTTNRRVEARLTQFSYGTFRGAAPSETEDDLRARVAIGKLEAEVARSRTGGNLHRMALANLATGNVRAAVRELQEALQLQPNDASVLSDLAAAELGVASILDAAEHAARALELDPTQQAAAFNWALALEKLSNRPMAIQAWERYLALDSASGWAVEAQQHLSRLRQERSTWDKDKLLLHAGADAATIERIVRKYPYRSRARTHNILLPAWVENGTPGDLAVIRAIVALRTDPFLRDVVEHAAARRAEVAPAFRVYAAAFKAQQSDFKESGALYAKATELLDGVQSPLALAAAIYAARDAESSEVPARLQALEKRLASIGDRYPSMLAEAGWLRGRVLFHGGSPHDSLTALRRALAYARRAGERENEAGIAEMIATQLDVVGDPAESERYRTEVLRLQDEINAHPNALYVTYMDTAFSSIRQGRPRLAITFVEAAAPIARAQANPVLVAENESQRALALLEIGDIAAAGRHIAIARSEALRNKPGKYRDQIVADVDYITGRIELSRRSDMAIAAFSSAIEVWDKNDWHLHSARGRMARGDAALAMGDRAMAESDFRAGIADIEAQRENLDEPAMRVAYFESAEQLFEQLIELLLDQKRFADALSVAEQKRARLLLDRIAPGSKGSAELLDAHAIAAAVPPRTALLEIALLDRGAELWLVSDGRIVHARSGASGAAIEAAVARHLAAIASDDRTAIRHEGRWLFDQLIAPIETQIPFGADLVVIPDGVLQAFPYATLVMPSDQYLIDRLLVITSPSANVFLRTPREVAAGPLLAVAQPAPAGFERLPRAAADVVEIARDRTARVLVGTEIDASGFLTLAADAGVVYFAGHARTDVDRPSRSALVFESRSGAPSDVTAEAIAATRLRNHPLVVLAACSTGRGKVRRNEGIDSLAAAFLQAGARGVVATLWDIEDRHASELFRIFHRNLHNGARASDALREAQRSMLHSDVRFDRSPAAWGGVVVIGTQEER